MPIHTSHKLTFDEINHQNKIVQLSEFYKFCYDFEIPLTKQQQHDLYLRKTAKDGKDNNVEF